MSRRADRLLRFVVIFSVVFVHVRSSVNSSSSPWNSVRLLPAMDDFGLASLSKQCITGAVMQPLSNYCFSSTEHFVLKHNFSIGLFTLKNPHIPSEQHMSLLDTSDEAMRSAQIVENPQYFNSNIFKCRIITVLKQRLSPKNSNFWQKTLLIAVCPQKTFMNQVNSHNVYSIRSIHP